MYAATLRSGMPLNPCSAFKSVTKNTFIHFPLPEDNGFTRPRAQSMPPPKRLSDDDLPARLRSHDKLSQSDDSEETWTQSCDGESTRQSSSDSEGVADSADLQSSSWLDTHDWEETVTESLDGRCVSPPSRERTPSPDRFSECIYGVQSWNPRNVAACRGPPTGVGQYQSDAAFVPQYLRTPCALAYHSGQETLLASVPQDIGQVHFAKAAVRKGLPLTPLPPPSERSSLLWMDPEICPDPQLTQVRPLMIGCAQIVALVPPGLISTRHGFCGAPEDHRKYRRASQCGNGKVPRAQSLIDAPAGHKKVTPANVHNSVVVGCVWELAKDATGCWDVEQAFDVANNHSRRVLASELVGHVWEAVNNRNANHIISKCIETMPPADVQFIIDELLISDEDLPSTPGKVRALKAAMHNFGCRIILRLFGYRPANWPEDLKHFERCSPEQLNPLKDLLLTQTSVLDLSSNKYGVIIIKHLIEECGRDAAAIASILERNLSTFNPSSFVGAAIATALGKTGSVPLAAAVLMQDTVNLKSMACNRYGNDAVKRAIEIAGTSHTQACANLAASICSDRQLCVEQTGRRRFANAIQRLLHCVL